MGIHILGLGLIAYLLGSIPFGFVFAQLFAAADIRTLGSRHTGTLNTWRGAGWLPASLTLLGDVGKGALSVWLAVRYGWSAYAITVAGLLAVVGHCWPIWLRLQGGMGVATAGSVALLTVPAAFGVALISWTVWSLVLRHSPRAISATALSIPLVAWWLGYPPAGLALTLAVCVVLFMRHIPQLSREYQHFWIDTGRVTG